MQAAFTGQNFNQEPRARMLAGFVGTGQDLTLLPDFSCSVCGPLVQASPQLHIW